MEGIRTYPVGHLRPFLRNGPQIRFEGLPVFGVRTMKKAEALIVKFVEIPIGPNRNTRA